MSWTKLTNEFREKKVFSFFWLSISGSIFITTKKFFGFVKVQQQLTYVRYMEFDDGWTYQDYWGSEEHKIWKHIKIMI